MNPKEGRHVPTEKDMKAMNQLVQLIHECNRLQCTTFISTPPMNIYFDVLSKALCLIASYETKLDNYALKMDILNSKLEASINAIGVKADQPQLAEHRRNPPSAAVAHQKKPKRRSAGKTNSPKSVCVVSDSIVIPTLNETLHNAAAPQEKEIQNGGNVKPHAQQWTEVRNRKNRRPALLCGTAGPSITTLRAVEARKLLHLWNMESNVDEVRQYLLQLCPTGTCIVEELIPKGNYKSYKIDVPANCYDKCYAIDVWPINARIKPWIHYRKPMGTRASDDEYMRWFCKTESIISNLNGLVIILGDLNLNSASLSIVNYYCYFLPFCGLTEKNEIMNLHGGRLDVVLVRESVGVREVLVAVTEGIVPIDPLYHPALDVEFGIESAQNKYEVIQPSNINPVNDWNFNKCDYEQLDHLLSNASWDSVLQSSDAPLLQKSSMK
ncbi:putative reverse transcriptase [Operophtera brumata]|uniref:Putative reverse transcriptase n=1 Tax=Operophtera brumata TaxID=104452 RepID=A0A0L7KHS1_OPEBR|nr:putative reverse transcriptase [Operophtera brumata]